MFSESIEPLEVDGRVFDGLLQTKLIGVEFLFELEIIGFNGIKSRHF